MRKFCKEIVRLVMNLTKFYITSIGLYTKPLKCNAQIITIFVLLTSQTKGEMSRRGILRPKLNIYCSLRPVMCFSYRTW